MVTELGFRKQLDKTQKIVPLSFVPLVHIFICSVYLDPYFTSPLGEVLELSYIG